VLFKIRLLQIRYLHYDRALLGVDLYKGYVYIHLLFMEWKIERRYPFLIWREH
jgi:hypothetical protein